MLVSSYRSQGAPTSDQQVSISGWGDWIFNEYGPGYYSIRVRIMSSDITESSSSPWVVQSEPWHYTGGAAPQDVVETLLELCETQDELSKDEIVSAVRRLDREELTRALLDIDSGCAEAMQELERSVFGDFTVDVADGMSGDFDQRYVSAAGFCFNPSAGPMSLTLGAPDGDFVIPQEYAGDSAVCFSLSPTGLVGKDLTVPVLMTIPVPDGLDPNRIVILHYASDGSIKEILLPQLRTVDGKLCACFVLTSFSDFALAQADPALKAAALLRDVVSGAAPAASVAEAARILGSIR